MAAPRAKQFDSADESGAIDVDGNFYGYDSHYLNVSDLRRLLGMRNLGSSVGMSTDDMRATLKGSQPAPQPAEKVTQPAEKVTQPAAAPAAGSVDEAIRSLLQSLPLGVDEDKVRSIVDERVDAIVKRPIQVTIGEREPVTLQGRQHRDFAEVLQDVQTLHSVKGGSVYLYGPAGTGKSTLCEHIAEALGVRFGIVPMGPTEAATALRGFIHASGEATTTLFLDYWTNGGLVLIDEADRAHPAALTTLQGALANGVLPTPDGGMVKRHPDCYIMLSGNTTMRGATDGHASAQMQDAAIVDRLVFHRLDVDWDMVSERAAAVAGAVGEAWVQVVKAASEAVDAARLRGVSIGTRAAHDGAAMLASGRPAASVLDKVLRKGLADDQWSKVESKLASPLRNLSAAIAA